MCNKSLLEGHLPSSQTSAIISPVIKMSGLDPDGVRSYLPISNLTYMSKIIDRMMYKQLADYLGKHSLLPEYQSGFRAHHSTETAVRKIMSDILSAADHGTVTLLGLLDMSAAFDTVEHFIVLDRLGTSFGIRGTALAWLDHSSPEGNNRSSSTVSHLRPSTSLLVFHKEVYGDRYCSYCTRPTSQSLLTNTGLEFTVMRMMGRSMCLTRPEMPKEWLLKFQPALQKLTHVWQLTVLNWTLTKLSLFGWAFDNNSWKSTWLMFRWVIIAFHFSPMSAPLGSSLTVNWTWEHMCSVSVGRRSTSCGPL